MPRRLVLALAVFSGCGVIATQDDPPDPTQAEVPLPAACGWNAFLLWATDAGVWTVRSFQVQPWFGCPEVVALDDKGRCTVLRSYSGKWTPSETVHDRQWLAPVAHGDVDPRIDGAELYTGGKSGRVFRVRARRDGGFDTSCIAQLPGEEVHTLMAGDLRPEQDGAELLAFTKAGAVVELAPVGAQLGFRCREVVRLGGRVRDAVLLPAPSGEAPWIATVSRAGEVRLLRLRGPRHETELALREPMGFGRIALGSATPLVLYVTRDDGLVLRLERRVDGFAREVAYAGPQGPRGLVAGRFTEDPDRESIAVFGYSKKVQLLSRANGEPWRVETVFTDIDKGHWLAKAEVDGRNGTDEIIGCGYGGRVFLLARPPAYGLAATVDPPPARTTAAGR